MIICPINYFRPEWNSSQIEGCDLGVKVMIISHIHHCNMYVLDQDADSVWVITLNCLGHNNAYL